MGQRGFGGSDYSWGEAADIWGWNRLGIHCLLLEEGIASEEVVRIAHCFGRQTLDYSTSRPLHFSGPFIALVAFFPSLLPCSLALLPFCFPAFLLSSLSAFLLPCG